MAIQPPPSNWKTISLGKDEKIWSIVIILMISFMGIFTTVWVFAGNQNPPEEYSQFEVTEFNSIAAKANTPANGVNVDTLSNGVPALSRTTDGDIYMVARQFAWQLPTENNTYEGIKLKVGQSYRLHIGSIDMLHGFELMGGDFILSLQIVPGYDYILDFIPTSTGMFRIVCNEYCGTGHHTMAAFMEVVE